MFSCWMFVSLRDLAVRIVLERNLYTLRTLFCYKKNYNAKSTFNSMKTNLIHGLGGLPSEINDQEPATEGK